MDYKTQEAATYLSEQEYKLYLNNKFYKDYIDSIDLKKTYIKNKLQILIDENRHLIDIINKTQKEGSNSINEKNILFKIQELENINNKNYKIIERQNTEINEYKVQINQMAKHKSELENINKNNRRTICEQENLINELNLKLEKFINELNLKLSSLEEINIQQNQRIKQYELQLSEMEAYKSELENINKNNQEIINEKNTEIDEYKIQIQQIEKDKSELEKENFTLKEEKNIEEILKNGKKSQLDYFLYLANNSKITKESFNKIDEEDKNQEEINNLYHQINLKYKQLNNNISNKKMRNLIEKDEIQNLSKLLNNLEDLENYHPEEVDLIYESYLLNEKYINTANKKLTSNKDYKYKTIFNN